MNRISINCKNNKNFNFDSNHIIYEKRRINNNIKTVIEIGLEKINNEEILSINYDDVDKIYLNNSLIESCNNENYKISSFYISNIGVITNKLGIDKINEFINIIIESGV